MMNQEGMDSAARRQQQDDDDENDEDERISAKSASSSSSSSAMHNKTSGARKSSKKKCWRKPKDKPKRPLSAYNLFFLHERSRIVYGEENTTSDVGTLLSDNKNRGPVPRHRRKTHGKVGFAELAKIIAGKWKTLDPATKATYEEQAQQDQQRYRKELAEWKKNQSANATATVAVKKEGDHVAAAREWLKRRGGGTSQQDATEELKRSLGMFMSSSGAGTMGAAAGAASFGGMLGDHGAAASLGGAGATASLGGSLRQFPGLGAQQGAGGYGQQQSSSLSGLSNDSSFLAQLLLSQQQQSQQQQRIAAAQQQLAMLQQQQQQQMLHQQQQQGGQSNVSSMMYGSLMGSQQTPQSDLSSTGMTGDANDPERRGSGFASSGQYSMQHQGAGSMQSPMMMLQQLQQHQQQLHQQSQHQQHQNQHDSQMGGGAGSSSFLFGNSFDSMGRRHSATGGMMSQSNVLDSMQVSLGANPMGLSSISRGTLGQSSFGTGSTAEEFMMQQMGYGGGLGSAPSAASAAARATGGQAKQDPPSQQGGVSNKQSSGESASPISDQSHQTSQYGGGGGGGGGSGGNEDEDYVDLLSKLRHAANANAGGGNGN